MAITPSSPIDPPSQSATRALRLFAPQVSANYGTRVAAALEWNAQSGNLHDVDYYWFHDFHCTQLILRYRSKQDTWKVQWQFTPW